MEEIPHAKLEKMVMFLYEIGSLRKIPRSHNQAFLTSDLTDNISSHIFRTVWIGWFLAKVAGGNPYKVVMMCLMHDTPETRSGDQNWVAKRYVKVFEDEIIADQFGNIPSGDDLASLQEEYKSRTSLEAKLAKDADLLDEIFLLMEYAQQGNKEAQSWLHIEEFAQKCQQYSMLSHQVSKTMALEIVSQNPNHWWDGIWTSERR